MSPKWHGQSPKGRYGSVVYALHHHLISCKGPTLYCVTQRPNTTLVRYRQAERACHMHFTEMDDSTQQCFPCAGERINANTILLPNLKEFDAGHPNDFDGKLHAANSPWNQMCQRHSLQRRGWAYLGWSEC